MNNPKFVIGEEVAICSVNYPHLNINKVEIAVVVFRKYSRCAVTGEIHHDLWIYKTSCNNPPSGYWNGVALRKLPPDESKSFDSMMEKLNQTEHEIS
jgi:hypothetical protein